MYGALSTSGATQGILVTASAFTLQARAFAAQHPSLLLVDGAALASSLLDARAE